MQSKLIKIMKVIVNEQQSELKKGIYLKQDGDVYVVADVAKHRELQVVCINSPVKCRIGQTTSLDCFSNYKIIPSPFSSTILNSDDIKIGMILDGEMNDEETGYSRNIMLVTEISDTLSGISLYLENCCNLAVGKVSSQFSKDDWKLFTGTLTLQNN